MQILNPWYFGVVRFMVIFMLYYLLQHIFVMSHRFPSVCFQINIKFVVAQYDIIVGLLPQSVYSTYRIIVAFSLQFSALDFGGVIYLLILWPIPVVREK